MRRSPEKLVAAVSGDVLSTHHSRPVRYDQTVTGLLQRPEVAGIGIEATSMTVGRFQPGLPHSLDPRRAQPAASTLVPTERIVERQRAVKDAFEI